MNDQSPPSGTPSADFVAVSLTNGIATITLDRPEVRNAINDQMRAELIAAFEWADADPEVRGVILTGAGKGFCSGGDIGGMRDRLEAPAGKVAFNGWQRQKRTHRGIAVIHGMSKPVISAVNGAAFGLGLDMALAGDFIIAASGAKLCMSFIKRGLVSDGGGMYFLPRRVGLPKAKELILTGRVVEAEEASSARQGQKAPSARPSFGQLEAGLCRLPDGIGRPLSRTVACQRRPLWGTS